jgi:hypothetical protein
VEPLRKELRFQGEKVTKFGSTYSFIVDVATFLDSNLQHHLYTNKEMCDFAIHIFTHLRVFENFTLDTEVMR